MTKDNLTVFLANELMKSKQPMVAVTREGVSTNQEDTSNIVLIHGRHEEADSNVIYYAAEIFKLGLTVHIYSSDTDVMVLALSVLPKIGQETIIITGTGENRRKVALGPIFDALGPNKASALPGVHTLTGCDTTGNILNKTKAACFAKFLKASDDTVEAMVNLGLGNEPDEPVLTGCEKFFCELFLPKYAYVHSSDVRWHFFKALKPNQGIEKLPPTQGSWIQHILRAHLQNSIYKQVLIP